MAESPENESAIARWFRNPRVVGFALLGTIGGAFQVAGVTSMVLANIILGAGVWIFITAEVWCSKWIKSTGRYSVAVVLLTSCLSGVVAIRLALTIADLKKQQGPDTTLVDRWSKPQPGSQQPSTIPQPIHPSALRPKQPPSPPPCGPLTAVSGGVPAVAGNDSATVKVTRSSSASGATIREFKTTGKGSYEVGMEMLPNWRSEVLEFKFSNNTSQDFSASVFSSDPASTFSFDYFVKVMLPTCAHYRRTNLCQSRGRAGRTLSLYPSGRYA
jgi:hypothetical protein